MNGQKLGSIAVAHISASRARLSMPFITLRASVKSSVKYDDFL